MPQGNALLLMMMRYPQELIDVGEYNIPEGARGDYRITPKELEFSEQLIETMSTEWKPGEYQDEFRERLHKVIKERMAAHGVVKHAEEEHEPSEGAATNVVDFMSLLQQSIDRNKRTPAKKASQAATKTAKKTARKTAKAPAKKSAAKTARRKSA
jgi:DNA end-binding protein Ku